MKEMKGNHNVSLALKFFNAASPKAVSSLNNSVMLLESEKGIANSTSSS